MGNAGVIINKLTLILSIILGFLLLIVLVDLCLGPSSGFVITSSTRAHFIDLSTISPKDKTTGIELVSLEDGKASVKIRGVIRSMKEGDVNVAWGIGRIQLLYISQEDGEIVLERITSGPRIRFRGYSPGDKSKTAHDILKQNGEVLVNLLYNRKTNPELGIELVSVETNGATIRFPGSEENIYAKSGGFFKIKNPIKGVSRVQLVHVEVVHNKCVLLRVISADKGHHSQ